jgi:hypothetical protein
LIKSDIAPRCSAASSKVFQNKVDLFE